MSRIGSDPNVVISDFYYNKFDYATIVVHIVVLLLFAAAYFVTKFCCFRKVLQDDPDGPTDIHIETNKAIEGQEKDFIKNGGIPGSKTSRVQHEKNMKRIKKLIGEKEAGKLEKELEARGLELDPDAIDKAIKEGGPELAKTMFKERCGPKEALKIIMKKQAAQAMKEDPELKNKLKENPELAKQACELGVINKAELKEFEEHAAKYLQEANANNQQVVDGKLQQAIADNVQQAVVDDAKDAVNGNLKKGVPANVKETVTDNLKEASKTPEKTTPTTTDGEK